MLFTHTLSGIFFINHTFTNYRSVSTKITIEFQIHVQKCFDIFHIKDCKYKCVYVCIDFLYKFKLRREKNPKTTLCQKFYTTSDFSDFEAHSYRSNHIESEE